MLKIALFIYFSLFSCVLHANNTTLADDELLTCNKHAVQRNDLEIQLTLLTLEAEISVQTVNLMQLNAEKLEFMGNLAIELDDDDTLGKIVEQLENNRAIINATITRYNALDIDRQKIAKDIDKIITDDKNNNCPEPTLNISDVELICDKFYEELKLNINCLGVKNAQKKDEPVKAHPKSSEV